MKVIAQVSFVGYDHNNKKYRLSPGETFDLPKGVDWLEKGLVIRAEGDAIPAKKGKK